MTEAIPSFPNLIAAARGGDAAAIAEIVRLYEPEVRIVARLRLGRALQPYVDSMDLVQSVHRSLIRGLQADQHDLQDSKQLIALALTMVRRKAARVWRKLRRQQRQDGAGDAPLGELIAALSQSGERPSDPAELADTIERLNRELDSTEQKLLEFHLLEYRTVEIARILNQNPDVLRVRLSRLRQKLRGRMSNVFNDFS
jgi:RNA polymerase sigma factor (sigma-70 family)